MESLISLLIHKSHAFIGSVAFVGGLVAYLTHKGSKKHIISGRIFAIGMLYSALTVSFFMVEDFRPLAIVLSLATIYFTLSAISVLRHRKPWSKKLDKILIFFPLLLALFAIVQLFLFLSRDTFTIGIFSVVLFIFLFSYSFIKDIKRLRSNNQNQIYYYKQHAFKITMAFGFAVMAVLRLGINIQIISLEYTVLIPLILFIGIAFFIKRNINFFFIKKPIIEKSQQAV